MILAFITLLTLASPCLARPSRIQFEKHVEIGGCILKFNRENNEFSITGPSNEKTQKTREIIFTIIKILFKQ